MMAESLNYKCKSCGKIYKTWDALVKHKKISGHLGVDVIEMR